MRKNQNILLKFIIHQVIRLHFQLMRKCEWSNRDQQCHLNFFDGRIVRRLEELPRLSVKLQFQNGLKKMQPDTS
jgi:hypothetical protein